MIVVEWMPIYDPIEFGPPARRDGRFPENSRRNLVSQIVKECERHEREIESLPFLSARAFDFIHQSMGEFLENVRVFDKLANQVNDLGAEGG